jgi:ABC-type nitrate/sulfonate/bicarbonate transport system substrate-binding protein
MAWEGFDPANVAKAEEGIQAWVEKHPEAAQDLMAIWKGNYMKAGHKTMARKLLAIAKELGV